MSKFKAHPDLKLLGALLPAVREYQALASKHGIDDIFQDNGGKLLQVMLQTGLEALKSREGNDAKDADGNEYEVKTVNRLKTKNFSTHHHLNPGIIEKYRKVEWIFAVYAGIELEGIFVMTPAGLEPYFAKWYDKWHANGGKDLNNPKIPMEFVVITGQKIYP